MICIEYAFKINAWDKTQPIDSNTRGLEWFPSGYQSMGTLFQPLFC